MDLFVYSRSPVIIVLRYDNIIVDAAERKLGVCGIVILNALVERVL